MKYYKLSNFVSKRAKVFTLEYDGVITYTDDKSKHFSINDLEKIISKNTEINMKLSFKEMIDFFPEYGIRVSTDNIINENIIENKIKVIHHDHAFKKIIYYLLFVENVIYRLKMIRKYHYISLMVLNMIIA